jgi:hypothetical protein
MKNEKMAGILLMTVLALAARPLCSFAQTFSPTSLEIAATQTAQIQVTVPPAFLATSAADISLSTANSAVFGIVGANSSGTLGLHFAQGATNVQTFEVVGVGRGSAGVTVSATAGLTAGTPPTVDVFTSFVLNPSFEDSATNATSIACWTGGSGVNTAAGPAFDNASVPDRLQVAVLQGSSTLSQQIYGLTPGKDYWLQFRYNANYSSGANVDLKVKFGGNVLATITDITAAGFFAGEDVPFYFTNIVFVPTNASELLEFDATPTVAGTTPALLLDAVDIVQRDADEIVIENPSFEASGETSYPGYLQPAPIDGWSITGGYGCNSIIGPFEDNGATPEQGEVLFMQGTCTASNNISGLTVGQAYTLSYAVNARTAASSASLTYDVGFGDIPLLLGQPVTAVGDDNPFATEYLTFTNDAPSNVLGFATHVVGDVTILLDAIHLVPGLRIPPQLVSESPTPGVSYVSQSPPLQFVLTQGSYPFNTSAFQLLLNGSNVAAKATVTTTNNGIIITYAYPMLPSGTNTVQLIVSDQNNPPMTVNTAYTFITVAAPALVLAPTTMVLYDGYKASFTTAAQTTSYQWPSTTTFQWQKNGSNLSEGGKFSGTATTNLVISDVSAGEAGSYDLVATVGSASATSQLATLSVIPLPVAGTYAAAVVSQNPMGYWRFSDGGGTNAFDYIAGNNAFDPLGQPLQAGPRPPAFGGFETTNTAPRLNGTSQGYASTSQMFNGLSEFTLMGWFNIDPDHYPLTNNPAGRASLFGQQWTAELSFYEGTNLYFYSAGISGTIFVTSGFAPGVWHFLAAVSDPGAGTTTVYLDGAVAGTGGACPGTTQPYYFSIGKNVSNFPTVPSFFPGSIDEVAAFDHALSASTVQALYVTGTGLGLTIKPQAGGLLQITWAEGHLESANDASGPWQIESTASSPWNVTPGAARSFYRAVWP